MTTATNLMAFGLNANAALALSLTPLVTTATGATQGSALQLSRQTPLVSIVATNSGNYVNLPTPGSTNCSLGAPMIVNNQTAGSIVVCASAGVNFSYLGASTAGTTGVSVSTQATTLFYAVTASCWVGLQG